MTLNQSLVMKLNSVLLLAGRNTHMDQLQNSQYQ